MTISLSSRPKTERLYLDLKELALAAPDGARLGGEAELVFLLGASRQTFRQAANLLESEYLVRWPGG